MTHPPFFPLWRMVGAGGVGWRPSHPFNLTHPPKEQGGDHRRRGRRFYLGSNNGFSGIDGGAKVMAKLEGEFHPPCVLP